MIDFTSEKINFYSSFIIADFSGNSKYFFKIPKKSPVGTGDFYILL